MTISSETSRSGPYSCNGVATVFAYQFKIFDQGDLEVTLTDALGNNTVLTLATDYTVSGVGNDNGGSVTTAATYASGFFITMRRKMALTQRVDLQNQGAYYADTVEEMVDRVTMIAQQVNEQTQRTLTIPVSDDASSLELPPKTARAGLALVFDGDGNATAGAMPDVPVSLAMRPVIQAPTIEAARSLMGLGIPVSAHNADYVLVDDDRARRHRSTASGKTWTLPVPGYVNPDWHIWIDDAAGGTIISAGANLSVNGGTGVASYAMSQGEFGLLRLNAAGTGYLLATTLPSVNTRTATIAYVIGDGIAPVTTGVKGPLVVDFSGTIQSATLLADKTGSVVVDIWKTTYAGYPGTAANKITASAPPTLSSAQKSRDATLTGWTKTISAGDVLTFNVNSAATVTRVTLLLKVLKG